MIALYADENVNARIVEGIRRRGIDVVTAQEVGLIGDVDDAEHLALATERGRAVLTSDEDFLGIASAWAGTGRSHAGILYYHQLWTTIGGVVRDVAARATELSPEQARDAVFYVPHDRKAER